MPVEFDPSTTAFTSIPDGPSVIDAEITRLTTPATPALPVAPIAAEVVDFDPATTPFTPVPDSAAPAAPVVQFDPAKESHTKVFSIDDLKTKTVEELDKESDFHPVDFNHQYEDALNADPIAKQKLLDVYKLREATFRTTADQLKGAAGSPLATAGKAISSVGTAVKAIVGGAGQVIKNVSDAGVGGAFRLLGAASVGGKAGEAGLNEEGKRIERAQAEIVAAPEAAATGTVDLLRRGVRTAVETAAKLDPTGFVQDVTGEKPFAELTNEEVATRFSNDVAGKKAISEASRGAGEMMKAVGLHADELKQAGIELRPGVIEAMSPALDITNLLPLGAGAKVGMMTKTGGRYAVRELATAATPLQASAFTKAMNSVAEGVGKSAKAVGARWEDTGVAVRNELKKLGDFGNVTGVGALAGGFRGTGAAILLGTKVVPKAVELAGRGLQAVSKSLPGAIRTGAEIGEEFVKGYGQGLLFTAPFMIGADAEEREGLLGAAGLGGVARGGLRGLKIVGEVAQDRRAETIFKAVDQSKPPETPAYGTDPRLDAESAAQIAKLSADPVRARAARVAQFEKTFDAETVRLDADGPLTPRQLKSRLELRAKRISKIPEVVKSQENLFGWARHLFKDSGVEFYATDDAGMMRQTGGQSGRGYTVKTGQVIAPDGTVKPLVRVFLNGDVEALPHEMLHALGDLNAPGYAEFRNEVNATLTPDQKKSFETIYNTVHNGGLPEAQWKYRLTPEQVSNEIAAELFSRTVLGEDLSGVSSPLRKGAALFTADLLENHLGIPLGKLTSTQAKDFVPKGTKIKVGFSTLGLRPGVKAQALGHNFVQSLLKQAKEGGLTAPPEKSALAGGTLVPGEISRRPPPPPPGPGGPPGAAPTSPGGTPPAPAPATPGATTPAVPPAVNPPSGPRNIRVTRERQDAFGISKAKEDAAALGNPDVLARVNEISEVIGTDTPALEILYKSVKDDGSPGDPTSRNPRRSAQEEERAAKAVGEIPENARELVQKIIVPVRWVTVGKGTLKSPFKPELIAMSLDKVAANVQMVVKEAQGKAGAEVPYGNKDGALTDAGWTDVIADLKTYAKNQRNGWKGDGGKLVRAEKSAGMDIPDETPGFAPTRIEDPNRANFLNMVQGFKLPFTNIRRSAEIPANLKGQKLAEINFRKVEPPVKAAIRPKDLLKQTFPAEVTEPLFPGRGPMDIGEPNPMRNQFWDAGVDVGKLIEGVERISPEQVATVIPRSKIDYQAPVSDIIRGGFLPGKSESLPLFDWEKRIRAENRGEVPRGEEPKIIHYIVAVSPEGKPTNQLSSIFSTSEKARDLAKKMTETGLQREGWTYSAVSKPFSVFRDEVSRNFDPYKANRDELMTNLKKEKDDRQAREPIPTDSAGWERRIIQELQSRRNRRPETEPDTQDFRDFREQVVQEYREFQKEHSAQLAAELWDDELQNEEVRLDREHAELINAPIVPPEVPPTILTQKSLEAVDWPQVRSELQSLDPETFKFQFEGADFARVDKLLKSLSNDPKKSPNSFPAEDRPLLTRLHRYGRDQLLERGESPGQLLPGGEEGGATMFIKRQTVDEIGREVLEANQEQWQKLTSNIGGLTGAAYKLGNRLKDPADVVKLWKFESAATAEYAKARATQDFDGMMLAATKKQFFTEALETATGMNPGKQATIARVLGEGWKPPFPEGAKGQLLPKSKDPRAVEFAAIRNSETGGIFRGSTHGEAMRKAAIAEGIPKEEFSLSAAYANPNYEQGFVTQGGDFLTRSEAMKRVAEIGQVSPENLADVSQLGKGENLESVGFQSYRQFLPGRGEDAQTGKLPHNPEIRDLAEEYKRAAGIVAPANTGYAPINLPAAKKFADFYEAAKHDPENAEVSKSYKALVDETRKQYEVMQQAGTVIKPLQGQEVQAYKTHRDVDKDVRENGRVVFLKTAEGGGDKTFANSPGNPLLEPAGITIDGYDLVNNDIFRAVHDYFGHLQEGYPFSSRGEFNAWKKHAEMYSPEAQGALAAETLTQNSWVNFGPHLRNAKGELIQRDQPGYTPYKERPFAPQKAMVVPKELIEEALGVAGQLLSKTEAGKKLTEGDIKKVPGRTVALGSLEIRGKRGNVITPESQFLPGKIGPRDVSEDSRKSLWLNPTGEFFDAGRYYHQKWAVENLGMDSEDAIKKGWIQVTVDPNTAIFVKGKPSRPSLKALEDLAFSLGRPVRDEKTEKVIISSTDELGGEKFLPKKRKQTPEEQVAETDYSKYDTSPAKTRRPIRLTGWIFPNQKFVPLDSNFHEDYLAEHSADLNKRFGTAFSTQPDVEDRLRALNKGFVRIRGGLRGEPRAQGAGGVVVEMNEKFFRKNRPTLENYLMDNAESIDNLTVNLLNDKGNVKDYQRVVVHELDGAEKANALLGVLDDLRLRGPEGQLLPGGEETLPGLNLPSEERAKQLRRRGFKGVIKITTPKAAQDFPLEPGDIVIKKKR